MRSTWIALAAMVSLAGPAVAADSWGLEHEKPLAARGKVVDVLCELVGDCPANCGEGKRQLGLLTGEGRLLTAAKGNVFFAAAVVDLLPFCGREIETDGLLIEHPAMSLYFVQYTREPGTADWQPAEAFITDWTAKNGEAEEWWRADPVIKEVIAQRGILGIPGLKPE